MDKFVKADAGKPRYDLLPPGPIHEVVKVLTFGAAKYGPDNWRLCTEPWRYVRAGLGHIFAHMRGEKLDEESELPHLAHAACCLLFLLGLEEQKS